MNIRSDICRKELLGASEHDVEDHEKLEVIQNALANRLFRFNGTETSDEIHSFYLDFSSFQSEYLEQIYEEETVTELLLQQYFSDEELIRHRNDIMNRLYFPVLLLWLKYLIPTQAEEEPLEMLLGFKSNAPRVAFDQVMEVIKAELDGARYERLVSKLK